MECFKSTQTLHNLFEQEKVHIFYATFYFVWSQPESVESCQLAPCQGRHYPVAPQPVNIKILSPSNVKTVKYNSYALQNHMMKTITSHHLTLQLQQLCTKLLILQQESYLHKEKIIIQKRNYTEGH